MGTKRICGSFLLIMAVGFATAETVNNELTKNAQNQRDERYLMGDTGKLDYETALRPAVLQKRSIANIARLLLGGNVPPNHPLVKYPEPKSFNLANNIMAALPAASSLVASASSPGWGPSGNTALQNIQQLFETKSKIIPYTGQVATGLTGLATVKGDLLRQIHSISTQAIAQAAAEAAARALAGAAAAHAVTNSIAHTVNPGAHTGIKGGWSSYQNVYANAPGKTPGEQPGPPYYSSSAHIDNYQSPPAYNNLYSPQTTPVPPTLPPYQSQSQYPNSYYTLYNTQQSSAQTPYTPAPPVGHARPTLSPSTLIATSPSGYSPSLSKATGAPLKRGSPIIVFAPSSNNVPLTSFRRAVPAGIFGRNAAQSAASPSILSTISSLLAASTAAYNAAFTGGSPQQSATLFSNLLPSASSPISSNPIYTASSPVASPAVHGSGVGPSPGYYNPGLQRQSVNALPQGSGNYGGAASGNGANFIYQQSSLSNNGGFGQAGASTFNTPSHPFHQHASGNTGQSFAQLGANSYASQSLHSPQFSGIGAASPGIGSSFQGSSAGHIGPGYSGLNGAAGPSNGHVSGWNTQHAGSPYGAASWPTSANIQAPGYASQAPGNVNNSPGGFGGAAQFPIASGSSLAQQTYSAPAPNAYQPSATHAYAQAQSFSSSQPGSAQFTSRLQHFNGNTNGVGGIRNSHLKSTSHDLRQSASTMGHDVDDDHSYQQALKRKRPNSNSYSSSRYPSSKKKASKRPSDSHASASSSSSNTRRGPNTTKRVIPTGSKKGSHFDSSVDVVDDYYYEGDRYDSQERRTHNTDPDTHENRWRSKNPSGQRTNSIHNHNSNGRPGGKENHAKQTPSKNVSGHGPGQVRTHSQSGRPKGSGGNQRYKKVSPKDRDRSKTKQQMDSPKTEAAHIYRGRIREQQQYESRDVYTTLPEYVFKIDERPDIFIRPGGQFKHGTGIRRGGVLQSDAGQKTGTSSSHRGITKEKKSSLFIAQSSQEDLEQSTNAPRSFPKTNSREREEEEFGSFSKAIDETSRADILTGIKADSGFITSEEFDPEEREAFVDDVYADSNYPRQDYDDEEAADDEDRSDDHVAK